MPVLTTKRFSSRHAYGTCLCPESTRFTPDALQALDRVTRVVDDVSLAAGPGNGKEMMVEHEDAKPCRLGELLLDPPVAPAADLAVVEVGLGRVDRDDGDPVLAQDRVTVAEELLEMDVADVARVVVPRDHDERVALEPVEVALRLDVLLLEAERRQVAGADDDVRLELVDVRDRALHQVRHEVRVSAVDVGEVRENEALLRCFTAEV